MSATNATAGARVRREADSLVLAGTLDRAAVPALWRQATELLAGGTTRFDLTAVDAVDSAGLALLAELAARVPGVVLHGEPAGLGELRDAYRLDRSLAFAR